MKIQITVKDKEKKPITEVNISRLAQTTGYSASHISRVLRRITNPSIACLSAMSIALDYDITTLQSLIEGGRIHASKDY